MGPSWNSSGAFGGFRGVPEAPRGSPEAPRGSQKFPGIFRFFVDFSTSPRDPTLRKNWGGRIWGIFGLRRPLLGSMTVRKTTQDEKLVLGKG